MDNPIPLPPKLPVLKGYRTLIASGLSITFGVLSLVDWNLVLNDPKAGITAIVIGLVMAFMRFRTDTPVGQPVHPAETTKPEPPKSA